jgi:hypothetical protein
VLFLTYFYSNNNNENIINKHPESIAHNTKSPTGGILNQNSSSRTKLRAFSINTANPELPMLPWTLNIKCNAHCRLVNAVTQISAFVAEKKVAVLSRRDRF